MMNDGEPTVGVTMADVARQSGVHISTVSRALKNDPRITPAVRERILKEAAALGYRPNPLISALSTLRRQHAQLSSPTLLAYIRREVKHPTDHLAGIIETARSSGYKVEAFTLNSDLTDKRLNQILTHRSIYGLILAPLPEAHGSFTLDWDRFATVALEYSFTHPRFDRIVPDTFQSVVQAMEQCERQGYTRVGMALTDVVHERNEGLLLAAYAHYRQEHPSIIAIPPLIVPQAEDEGAIRAWLLREQPEVVISSNHLLPAIEKCLAGLDINVPSQIGLVNLNAHPERMKHSGIMLNRKAMGVQAAVQLIHKLNNNQFGIPANRITIQTDTHWVDGETLLPAAAISRPCAFGKVRSVRRK